MNATLRHMQLELDAAGIAWLSLDVADSSANTLSSDVLGELEQVLDRLENDTEARALVIASAKKGFIAGADVHEIGRLGSADEARALIERGQSVMDRIAGLRRPTVALIRGHCLGGGLELALACRYRVSDDDPGTRLGLPEVQLGIHPGFGGSARLPQLVGPLAALDLILSGRTIDGKAARRMGLVDYALSPWQMEAAARHLAHAAPAAHRPRVWQRALNTYPARLALRPIMQRKLRQRVRPEHYPAPYAALDLWVRSGGQSLEKRLQAERDSLVRLIDAPAAGNLIRVYGLRERLRGEARGQPVDLPRHVHVVGAGTMGGDIAAWLALNGHRVTLSDERPEAIAKALKRAQSLFKRQLKRHARIQAAQDRLIGDDAGQGAAVADLVIEAIVEQREAKRELYRRLEAQMRPDAVLATNTSSLPLEQLADALERPGRLIGLHFFNPVAKMPLVEIVAGEASESSALDRGQALMAAVGKLPLRVKSGPGFLVNRLLMPYMLKAAKLFDGGTPRETIDEAAKRFGMPMGPLELGDAVGLDICVAAGDVIGQAYGFEVPDGLRRRALRGDLGRKSGEGYYIYDRKGRPKRQKQKHDAAALDKLGLELLTPLLDEAERCRDESVVADGDLVDAGAIFGTGFAPFTGGPLHYRAKTAGEPAAETKG
jgi:3-hydroxyacyl-CoA dehydrogenase/enoyl-CoA hydratase/3-hydroxybutyryl-CoA epimerase